jgi:tight adherence protein C
MSTPDGTAVIALTLGVAWGVTVAALAAAHRPPERLPQAAGEAGARDGTGTGARRATPHISRPTAVTRFGAAIRRQARRPADPAADRRAGWACVASVALLAVVPPLSPLPAAWVALAPSITARKASRAHEAAVVDQLPDAIDLLALTTSAGLTVAAAFDAIGTRPGGPVGAGIGAATAHAARGGTTAEALALLSRATGPAARPLVDVLAEHDRYGTPLRPALDRIAIEARLRRRRHAEEAARRLPVTLLFPLVLTTLPAFVLLTDP